MRKEKVENVITPADFNKKIIIESRRDSNGSLRVQEDYSNCVSMTEQHTAHLSDINYLMEKMKPDELANYIAARNQHRTEILGHDFSQELSLQDAMNTVVIAREIFSKLKPEIQSHFRSPNEFFMFIEDPKNQEKMVQMGILTKKEVQSLAPKVTPEPKNEPSPKPSDPENKPN